MIPATPLRPMVLAVGAALILSASPPDGADAAPTKSEWTRAAIEVDGDLADWAGALAYMPDDDFTLGIRNDSAYVYVALMLDDPMLGTRALMNGLTVWFDALGEPASTVGIRFPVAAGDLVPAAAPEANASSPSNAGLDRDARAGEPPGRGGAFRDPERLRAQLDRASYELDLVDGEGRARRFGMDDARAEQGVVAAIGESKRVIACEFRIPLERGEGRATALGAKLGDSFDLRIESEAMRRPERPEGRGGFDRPRAGGFPGGGRGGFGDGPNGAGSEPSGRRGTRPFEAFEFKTRVVLASTHE